MRHSMKRSAVVCCVLLLVLASGSAALGQVPQAAAPSLTPQAMLSQQATELLDNALAGEMAGDVALQFRPFFFPSFTGGTLCMLGIRVGKAGLMFGADPFAAATGAAGGEQAKLELFGSVMKDGVEVGRLGTSFEVSKNTGSDEFSGTQSFGDNLQPGSYKFVWGVRDTISDKAGSRTETFEVPNYMAGGLATSSVMLVTGSPQGAPGTFQPNTVYDGVRVLTATFPDGIDHVIPAITREVMLTFIVVGAQMDATGQAFDIELNYRILTAEGSSIWRAPAQTSKGPTVGQPIPLSQISNLSPGGRYSFEIVAKDVIGGTETKTLVPFELS